MFPPVRIAVAPRRPPTAGAGACAVAAGVPSPAVPYLADLFTLRQIPARTSGLFMSADPVLAPAVGRTVPGQSLGGPEWAGMGAVVAAHALGILASRN